MVCVSSALSGSKACRCRVVAAGDLNIPQRANPLSRSPRQLRTSYGESRVLNESTTLTQIPERRCVYARLGRLCVTLSPATSQPVPPPYRNISKSMTLTSILPSCPLSWLSSRYQSFCTPAEMIFSYPNNTGISYALSVSPFLPLPS